MVEFSMIQKRMPPGQSVNYRLKICLFLCFSDITSGRVQHTSRWTRPLIVSLKHRKTQIFKLLAIANHAYTWWHSITSLQPMGLEAFVSTSVAFRRCSSPGANMAAGRIVKYPKL